MSDGGGESDAPQVAVFRPDDGRLESAVALLESLGVAPVPDPMLAVRSTGRAPRTDADWVVLTSTTGVSLAAETGWTPADGTDVAAIGATTADALREHGYDVDLVPDADAYSSSGLVDALRDRVDGARVEVARSDHGSAVLTDGLGDAGAYVHETVLYRLVRPADSGVSAERAAAGDLDAALFTSSLTVEHFLATATGRDVREDAIAGLNDAVVGAIGDPTRETAEQQGIAVDVIPDTANFEALARAVVEAV